MTPSVTHLPPHTHTCNQVINTFDAKTHACTGTISPAKEQYDSLYRAETHLNDTFHKFVYNYQLAYQGPNTARAQIGSRFETLSECVCVCVCVCIESLVIGKECVYVESV